MNSKLIEQAKRHALGQYLTEWGDLEYEDVLEALYDSDNGLPEAILVWQPFEYHEPTAVGEAIEDLFEVFKSFGEDAFNAGKDSK